MAAKKTVAVAADNLVQLGAERLAGILLELAGEQPAVKRRLRFELAGEAGGEMIAAEMNKRIAALHSARSFIDSEKRTDLVRDLDLANGGHRAGSSVASGLALDLKWRCMARAEPVLDRVDDSNGTVGAVFHGACEDLGYLAVKARPDPVALAEQVYAAVTKNNYGEFDGLVPAIFAALGTPGIAALKARLITAMRKHPDTGRYDSRAAAVRRALQDLADGEGDVDAYIALVPVKDGAHPDQQLMIGRRLLAAGRANEAVAALEVATPKKRTARGDLDRSRRPLRSWLGWSRRRVGGRLHRRARRRRPGRACPAAALGGFRGPPLRRAPALVPHGFARLRGRAGGRARDGARPTFPEFLGCAALLSRMARA